MAANFEKKDGMVYTGRLIDDVEETLLGAMFDTQVDFELVEINKKIKEEKLLRNMCRVKIGLFPFQYVLTRIFLGKTLAADVLYCNGLYWKFIKRQMSAAEFKKQLQNSLKNIGAK